MFRAMHAVVICLVLAQLASSQVRSQTGAVITEPVELAQSSDAAAGCRQAPSRRCVAELAIATIEATNHASTRNWMLLELALAQARGGDTAGALTTLHHIQGGISNYGQILEAITRVQVAAGDIAPVLTEVEKIEDGFQRAFAFVEVAEKSAAAGSPKAAREALRLALATAASVPSLKSRAFVLTSTADRAASLGDLETANEALALAWELTKTVVTSDTRARILASIAITRATMGEITRAMSTAETIEETPERAAALTRVGEAQAKAGGPMAARDTLQRATAAASEIADASARSWALIQVTRAYVTMDDRAAADGLLQSVLAAVPTIKDRGKREQALVWICDAQTAMGALEAALSTAARIEDFSADAGRMAEVRNADGVVIRTVPASEASKSLGNHDGAVSRIVEAQLKAGNLPLALEAVKEMRDGYWRASRLADMAKARAEAADRERARMIIAAAAEAIEQIESDKWRASAMVDVAEVQAMIGDVAAAIATTAAITDKNYWDLALFRIAVGMAKSGSAAAAEGISDPYARSTILATLAKWRIDKGDRAAGLEVVRAALSSAESIGDGKLRARVLHEISEAQVLAGDVDGVQRTTSEALKLVEVSDNAKPQEAILLTIAEAQANASDFVGALATAAGISDSDLRAHALVKIAAAFYR